jgi:hypothetical protein
MDIVKSVAEVLGFKLMPSMIDAAHRLAPIPSRSGEPRGIIVKFCRRIDMDEMRRLAIRRKGFSAANLGFSSDQKIYVNLSMTRETRALWYQTRKAKDELHFKFAWITSSGKIFLRKSEEAAPILIEDSSDIQKLRDAQSKSDPRTLRGGTSAATVGLPRRPASTNTKPSA